MYVLSMRKQKELAFFRNIAKLVIPVKEKGRSSEMKNSLLIY